MNNFWNKKKVLITGASGFIGSHVVDYLVENGADVTVQVSRKTKPSKIKRNLSHSLKKIKIVKADLTDANSCFEITKNQSIIFNFAALDGGSIFKKEHAAEIFKTNSRITLNMLEAARVANIEKFLLVSSIEVYPKNVSRPLSENYGLFKEVDKNTDGYVRSKIFSETTAKKYSEQYGLKINIVRPGNVYGPRDYLDKGRVIPTFIEQALNNKPITIWNNGEQKKSFIYVYDLVNAIVKLVERYEGHDPVNIAGEKYISIRDLAQLIIGLTKSKSKIINLKSKDLRTEDMLIDTKKARKIIRFKENSSLEEGLKETINYFRMEAKALR